DLDLNLDDFLHRVNSDLVGKVVNIASRCAGFILKRFDGQLSERLVEPELYRDFVAKGEEVISVDFEGREFSKAMREVMALADHANQYIDDRKPWVLIKDPDHRQEVQEICTVGLNLFRILMVYLKPVLPVTAGKAEEFLNIPPLSWGDLHRPLLGHRIKQFKPLMTRVEKEKVDALVDASREDESRMNQAGPLVDNPIAETIGIEDF
ncbi:MAG: methionine--tRNA ligase, partial [Gammaproteobacteria bacterium]|nr:methionine--tRNA ligase [Gammaproteobacteria bacterium]